MIAPEAFQPGDHLEIQSLTVERVICVRDGGFDRVCGIDLAHGMH